MLSTGVLYQKVKLFSHENLSENSEDFMYIKPDSGQSLHRTIFLLMWLKVRESCLKDNFTM